MPETQTFPSAWLLCGGEEPPPAGPVSLPHGADRHRPLPAARFLMEVGTTSTDYLFFGVPHKAVGPRAAGLSLQDDTAPGGSKLTVSS